MGTSVAGNEIKSDRRGWLRATGGISALLSGLLLLAGTTGLIAPVLRDQGNWFLLIQNNWLVKIFILHAGLDDAHAELRGLNVLDILILVLVSLICLGLAAVFTKARRTWSLVAFALSLAAIALFLATANAGRSTVMLAVLILSLAMWGQPDFNNATAVAGVLASVFLFAGDLTVGVQSDLITALFAVGYLLLMAWFFLMAENLFRARTA